MRDFVVVLLSPFPLVALLHLSEERVRTACPSHFAYATIDDFAKREVGRDAFVRFSPPRWISRCHFELEADIFRAVPNWEPRQISVTMSVTNNGRPVLSTRTLPR